MKLIFVRHGKDADGYRGGWSKLPLIPEGIEQTERLAAHIKENACVYGITRILASDLPRAMATAERVAFALGLEVQMEPGLRETNNGELAGMPNDIALERYPGLFFSSLDMDEPYPGGESPREFFLRIEAWFSAFCARCADEEGNVLVVTHGGVINVIYHLVKGMEWSNKNRPFETAYCGIHVLNVETMAFEVENKNDFLQF